MIKYTLAFLFLFSIHASTQGQQLPVIKANSKVVDILDGNDIQKGNWNISPEIKPDIFYVSRFRGTKKVAFYTDMDSISFMVEPEKEYPFVILLNNRDSAFTTISTFSAQVLTSKKKRMETIVEIRILYLLL